MTKVKIVEIECCYWCPYCEREENWEPEFTTSPYRCSYLEKIIEDADSFLENCPLKDGKEDIK